MFKAVFTAILMLLFITNKQVTAQIVINEICTFNDDVLEDEDGDKSDWIELYNTSNSSQNLSNYAIYSKKQASFYNLPNINLNPFTYQIVFLSGKNKFNAEVHANFKMLVSDTISVIHNLNTIHLAVVPDLFVDHSFGAYHDGTNNYEIFLTPTPGATNDYVQHVTSYTHQPVFSLQSGFYNESQFITITNTNPDAITYYTVNGNEPNLTSNIYSTPISINQTSVIKAFSISPGLPASKTICKTYFINEAHNLSVISISTDSLLLFDSINGLLMLGPNANPYPPYYGANFWSDTQIEVHVQIFDKHQSEIINQDCELQIHGGSMNRSQAMKSFRLLSKKKYEKDRFYASLIPDKSINAYRKFVLRNGSSDFLKSQLREGLIHKNLIKNTFIDANGYEPCVVYINGKYYGLSEIREKIDEYYVEQNYGVDKDNVEVLVDTNLVDIGDWLAFDSTYRYVLHHDMREKEDFNWVENKIDLKNMADYFIAQTYFDNNDWPSGNLRLWRQKNPGSKFKYIAFDLDASLGTFEWSPFTLNMLHDALNYFTTVVPIKHCIIFKKLLENDDFKKYFINRYADLFNTAMSEKYLMNLLDRTALTIQPEINRHFNKWGKTYADWGNEINLKIKPYITNRYALSKEDVLNEFNLPAFHQIKLKTFPEEAFYKFSLNSVQISENNFEGYYYQTVPIWFKALSKEGYIFSHWQQDNGNKFFNDSIEVNLTANSEFTAIYFPEKNKNEIVVYPNPNFNNKLFVRMANDIGSLQNISIFNALGEVIYTNSNPKIVGEFTIELETMLLNKGTYFVKVELKDRSESIKFMVL
jgi:hypothetical protein